MKKSIATNRRIILLLLAAGWVWLLYQYSRPLTEINNGPTVCLLKNVAGIACPSCGTTRSAMMIMHGEIMEGMKTNPLGLIALTGFLLLNILLLLDLIRQRNNLPLYMQNMEAHFRKPAWLFLFGLFMLLNWIWNIQKQI